MYIADSGANCIRKVAPSGAVSPVAGGGSTSACSTTPMAATAVSSSSPDAMAIDTTGGLVIADTGRNCIRRVAGGTVTHVAGGGSTSACTAAPHVSDRGALSVPGDVSVDSTGAVIIADTGRDCIRRVAGGTVTHVAGGGNDRLVLGHGRRLGHQPLGPEASGSARRSGDHRRQGRGLPPTGHRQRVSRSPSTAPTVPAATAAPPSLRRQAGSRPEALANGDLLVSDRDGQRRQPSAPDPERAALTQGVASLSGGRG